MVGGCGWWARGRGGEDGGDGVGEPREPGLALGDRVGIEPSTAVEQRIKAAPGHGEDGGKGCWERVGGGEFSQFPEEIIER